MPQQTAQGWITNHEVLKMKLLKMLGFEPKNDTLET